jgi:ABC-2 type transport system permease protein
LVAQNNLQNQLLTISSSLLFVVGKILTFVFTLLTVSAIFTTTSAIQGYTLPQAVIFAVIFSLVDSSTQFLFRSIYSFRPVLLRGEFDLDLVKPLPSFFRPLFSGPDFLDLPLIVIQLGALVFFFFKYQFHFSPVYLLAFIAFFTIALLAAFSLHLLMAAFSILTTEIDNITWIYRSFIRAGLVPTDIYQGAFRFILDYLVPVTLLVTLPAKALLGLLTLPLLLYALLLSFIFLLFSLSFWRFALRRYTSTGS